MFIEGIYFIKQVKFFEYEAKDKLLVDWMEKV